MIWRHITMTHPDFTDIWLLYNEALETRDFDDSEYFVR